MIAIFSKRLVLDLLGYYKASPKAAEPTCSGASGRVIYALCFLAEKKRWLAMVHTTIQLRIKAEPPEL